MQQFFSLLSWRLFTAQHVSGVFPSIIRSSMTAVSTSGFTFVSWWQPAGRPVRPRTQHDCHHDTKVNPEAVTAVIELLMMGGKTSVTCWAVNKRQDNKLKNCCIWLVIYLNCTMIHGLTNLKFYIYILAHSICKMWIIQEPKKLALWNKRHFEEKNGECAACLKYSVLIIFKKSTYKMQHLEGSGTPVLYVGSTVLKGWELGLYTFIIKPWRWQLGAESCRSFYMRYVYVITNCICGKTCWL
jgi:hypothetical protein